MAYDTDELKQRALEVIKKHNLSVIEDIVVYIGINKSTFYTHKLHENDDIRDAVWKNKQFMKQTLREKWFKSDNATLQTNLMKLIGTYEEYQRLSNSKQEINLGGQKDNPLQVIDFSSYVAKQEEGVEE